jgi:hypothetical protein
MPLGNNGYHSHNDTPMIEALVAAVLLNTDNYARDPDMRRLSFQNGGSLGNRYGMEDALRMDDIRKYVCSFPQNSMTCAVSPTSLIAWYGIFL